MNRRELKPCGRGAPAFVYLAGHNFACSVPCLNSVPCRFSYLFLYLFLCASLCCNVQRKLSKLGMRAQGGTLSLQSSITKSRNEGCGMKVRACAGSEKCMHNGSMRDGRAR